MRGYFVVGCTISLLACGGGGKKTVKKPKVKHDTEETVKAETPADRERKRHEEALKLIPEGSSCLPASLKAEGAPRLDLAASGPDAILCAVDTDASRLLGAVGCWKIDLATGALAYKAPELMPGRGVTENAVDGCVQGYCPKGGKASGKAFIAKSLDGSKVAVLSGDDVHVFNAESKDEESSFTIRGDKGLTNDPIAVHFLADHVIVEGADQGSYSAVWVFKADGTPMGPVTGLGGKDEKPISTYKGSLSLLDKTRIAVADHGMETLTTYQLDNGARAKLVRHLKTKPTCKAAELDAYWHDGDKVSDKCKDSIEKLDGYLMGATAVAGAKNLLVLLRGARLGELGVLDAKSLDEKKAIKLPWCDGDKKEAEEGASEKADKDDDEKATVKNKKGGATSKSSDPQEGGE